MSRVKVHVFDTFEKVSSGLLQIIIIELLFEYYVILNWKLNHLNFLNFSFVTNFETECLVPGVVALCQFNDFFTRI